MSEKNLKNIYDDDNIPEVDLPQDNNKTSNKSNNSTNSLSASTQSAKQNSGGE